MATGNELRRVKRGFQQKANFPNVIGCIDGTHIPVKKPNQNSAAFRNRKGFYSLNQKCSTKFLNELNLNFEIHKKIKKI